MRDLILWAGVLLGATQLRAERTEFVIAYIDQPARLVCSQERPAPVEPGTYVAVLQNDKSSPEYSAVAVVLPRIAAGQQYGTIAYRAPVTCPYLLQMFNTSGHPVL